MQERNDIDSFDAILDENTGKSALLKEMSSTVKHTPIVWVK